MPDCCEEMLCCEEASGREVASVLLFFELTALVFFTDAADPLLSSCAKRELEDLLIDCFNAGK